MATSNPQVKNVGITYKVSLRDFAVPGSFKSGPTLAVGDVKVNTDGAGLTNVGTLPTASGIEVTGVLTAGEMNGDHIWLQFIDQTSPKEWSDLAFWVPTTHYAQTVPQTGDVYPLVDTEVAAIKAKTDQFVFTVANQVDANALSGGSAAPTAAENADAVWDELRAGHTLAGSFGQASQAVRNNVAAGGALGYITLDSGASAADDYYNGLWVAVLSGTGSGQIRQISDYNGTSKQAAVTQDWVTAPYTDSIFAVF